MDFTKELEAAKKIAVAAGEAIMEIYETGDFGIEMKSDQSPLTKADKESNRRIVSYLRELFPEYGILS